ncbi:MAG: SLC13 family permease, partial [Methylobacterium sp.]
MSDITIIGLIIAVVIVLFVTNRVPVVIVAMLTPLALWATGVLSLQQVLAGFGDPAVIVIATRFIVSAGLEPTGV